LDPRAAWPLSARAFSRAFNDEDRAHRGRSAVEESDDIGKRDALQVRGRWGAFGYAKFNLARLAKVTVNLDLFSFHEIPNQPRFLTQGAGFSLELLGESVVDFGLSRVSYTGGFGWNEWETNTRAFNLGFSNRGGIDFEVGGGLLIGGEAAIDVIEGAH
jgi:hypothetical protein